MSGRRRPHLSAAEVEHSLLVAATLEFATVGDPVSDDPVYVRFVDSKGLCLRHDPANPEVRCTRQRDHGGLHCVAEGTHQIQAVWRTPR